MNLQISRAKYTREKRTNKKIAIVLLNAQERKSGDVINFDTQRTYDATRFDKHILK